TATADNYSIAQSSVTIPAGQTTASIPVSILDDQLFTLTRTLTLTLQPGSFPLGAVSSTTITIQETDPPPTVSLTQSIQTVVQDTDDLPAVTVTATLSAVSGADTTLPFQLSGTAQQGTDYTVSPTGSLVIPAGSLSASATVTILNPHAPEPT